MRSWFLIGAVLGCLAACARSSPQSASLGTQVTRSHRECASERSRALTDSQLVRTLHPQVTGIVTPPSLFSRDLHGHSMTVHLLVDEWGQVVRDSTEPPDLSRLSPYASTFRDNFRRFGFRPAVLDGCAVPAWATFRFSF